MHKIIVRDARSQDKQAIISFCQNTFEWGDYIPYVWDRWLADSNGKTIVGVVEEKPIGMMHVAFLDDGTAWMEGMRVHPEYRRLGASLAMESVGREYARAAGRKLARLATDHRNFAAQKTLAKQGYQRVAEYVEWECDSKDGLLAPIASEGNADRILELWRNVSCKLVGDPEWHWAVIGDKAILKKLQDREIRMARDGFAILNEARSNDGISLFSLVGDDASLFELAESARAEARYRGFDRVGAVILDDNRANHALERAGFIREGALYIYEQNL